MSSEHASVSPEQIDPTRNLMDAVADAMIFAGNMLPTEANKEVEVNGWRVIAEDVYDGTAITPARVTIITKTPSPERVKKGDNLADRLMISETTLGVWVTMLTIGNTRLREKTEWSYFHPRLGTTSSVIPAGPSVSPEARQQIMSRLIDQHIKEATKAMNKGREGFSVQGLSGVLGRLVTRFFRIS